jgi:hypothetical protein
VGVRRVLSLYLVVFAGFVGYSLMIAIFTPLVLRADGMLPRSESGRRTHDLARNAPGSLSAGGRDARRSPSRLVV